MILWAIYACIAVVIAWSMSRAFENDAEVAAMLRRNPGKRGVVIAVIVVLSLLWPLALAVEIVGQLLWPTQRNR